MKKTISIIIITILMIVATGCATTTIKYEYRPMPYVGSEFNASIESVLLEQNVIQSNSLATKAKVYLVDNMPNDQIKKMMSDTRFSQSFVEGKDFHFKTAQNEDEAITNRMQNDAYIQQSIDFISNSGLNFKDLNMKPLVYEQLSRQAVRMTENDTLAITDTELLRIGVVFYREPINGIELVGTVPCLDLSFDNQNQITDIRGIWFDVKESEEINVISIEDAISRIKTNDKRLIWSEGIVEKDTLRVDNVELVYYCNPDMYEGDALLPHYKFSGKNRNGSDSEIVVCAVVDEKLSLQKEQHNNLGFGDEKPITAPMASATPEYTESDR